MSPTPETFIFTKEVPLADADGQPIREGSVLREINVGEQGVVVRVIRAGDMGPMASAVGDLLIRTNPGCTRVTNRYNQWRHVPHEQQSYDERLLSWRSQPYGHDGESSLSPDEGRAISGIMALLPEDAVDWDWGPTPNSLDDALAFLVAHLNELKDKDAGKCQA